MNEKLIDVINRYKNIKCPKELKNSLNFTYFNGQQIETDKTLFDIGINDNDVIYFINKENQDLKEEEGIIIKEHYHKLIYCISLLDWNCFLCKTSYSKLMAKYYCSLCHYNLCDNCHLNKNLPKRKAFPFGVEPSNLAIKNPF